MCASEPGGPLQALLGRRGLGLPISASRARCASMALSIDYDSEDFATGGPVQNGRRSLATSWDELLWAALTVGRPNRHTVFRHGTSSVYEALFRLSLIRMTLEQMGPTAGRFRRTEAARTLDPSEKGAVNYFLGLAIL